MFDYNNAKSPYEAYTEC